MLTTLNVPTLFILSSRFLQVFRFLSFGQHQQDIINLVGFEQIIDLFVVNYYVSNAISAAPYVLNNKDFRFCQQTVVMRNV